MKIPWKVYGTDTELAGCFSVTPDRGGIGVVEAVVGLALPPDRGGWGGPDRRQGGASSCGVREFAVLVEAAVAGRRSQPRYGGWVAVVGLSR